MAAIGEDNVVAHKHHRKRCRRARRAQPVHQLSLESGHATKLLSEPCRDPLGEDSHHHHYCQQQCHIPSGKKHLQIYHHSHTDKEIGNKQSIAHKLKVVHQCAHSGNESVEHQPGEEGAEDAFHPYYLHQSGTQKHHCQHKDELQHSIAILTEKPPPNPREKEHHAAGEHSHLHHQKQNVESAAGGFALIQTAEDGEQKQRQAVGNCRGTHTHTHTALARHSVAAHYRIAHQRVGGIHARYQQCRHRSVVQEPRIDGIACHHRHQEAEHAKHHRLVANVLEVAHIHLQAGKKHDVKETYIAKQPKAVVASNHIHPILADNHPGEYHSNNMRDAKFAENYWCKKNDTEHEKENPRRVGDGKTNTNA